MKINFPSLFQTSLERTRFFLLFGNDKIVFERALSFLQKKLNAGLEFKTESDLLLNPLPQPSLFGEPEKRTLTVISPTTDKVLTILGQVKEGTFVFISEKARAQSKLVTHFTQDSSCLAIASYASPLTPAEFGALTEGMNIPPSVKSLLLKTYQNDYMGLLAALHKIKLYGDLPEGQVENFLQGASFSEEFSVLTHAFLMKDKEAAILAFPSLAAADIISFLRSLSRSFQTLLELTGFKSARLPIPWQTLSSPVFFKEKPLFETALSKWQRAEVKEVLETLLCFEHRVKSSLLTDPHLRQGLLRFLNR